MRSVRKALGPARLHEIPIVSGASGGLEKKLVCALAKFCSRPHGYCESNVAGEVADRLFVGIGNKRGPQS